MKKKPIFKKILIPLTGLVLIEILIFVSCIFSQGLISELQGNERDVVNEKIKERKSVLENHMIRDWMNLDSTVSFVNETTKQLLKENKISLDTLNDSSEDAALLFEEISDELIKTMRVDKVTGIYVVLNIEDLIPSLKSGHYVNKPGIYLRDRNPDSRSSNTNADIMIKRSPISVVQKLEIATDKDWNVTFDFKGKEVPYYDFLLKPFQLAYHNPGKYSWKDMGYWSAPYQLTGDDMTVFSYSVPLILEDGTVYGVLGIDITVDYLQTFLENSVLDKESKTTYFLAKYREETGTFYDVIGNGDFPYMRVNKRGENYIDDSKYYVSMETLSNYNLNAPFSEERWVLAGIVPNTVMDAFVNKMEISLVISILLTLIIGIVGSLLISYKLQLPIFNLSQEMQKKNPGEVVELKPTGIVEIDQMSDAVTHLSRDVIESGKKFSTIIEMASTRIAGFQIDHEKNTLFLTEHFFEIFGQSDIDERGMTIEQFRSKMLELEKYFVEQETGIQGYIYQIPDGEKTRFVRMKIRENEKNSYGLAEDVTQAFLERQILTYERDHDALTNLYNRRAFNRKLKKLFERNDIGVGAFLMMDMDNLKYINDTYGHDYGDRYILNAANALRNGIKGKAYYARISGDEFNVFLYGYETREAVEEALKKLRESFEQEILCTPDGAKYKVQASGGVSWYPQDSRFIDELMKYADYAMYMVKNNKKGEIINFDKKSYLSQDSLMRYSAALTRMIEQREVYYALQPIVDARTGEIFAYEALMRPTAIEFSSVKDVMETARREGKLNQIEEMTWHMATEHFEELINAGKISQDSHLFINSIPNQRMSTQSEEIYLERFKKYHKQIVMELTEDEQIEGTIWEEKQIKQRKLGGKIALDDYGTGYNSEKTLLSASPDFIKVDIVIISGIQDSPDKRSIMNYIVNYAHERGKYIIAEGVETREEAETVIALGADYLQGYYIAKPKKEPDGISLESKLTIEKMRHKNG